MSILLGILTFVLILVSVLLVLIVLMQRAKNDGGMGAAMGGGMAEATFGADTSNVLSKMTINLSITFFVLAFGLYLGRIYQRAHATDGGAALPTITAPAALPSTSGTNFPAADSPMAPTPSVELPATTTATPESAAPAAEGGAGTQP